MAKFCHHNLIRILAVLLMFGACPPASAAPKKPVKKAAVAKPTTPKIVVPKASPEPLAPGELPLVAQAAALVDSKTGTLIYQKRADQLQYPASTTKILTALLVIEAGDLDKLVTVELADTQVEPSALYLKPGEQFPRRHLLYALLLKSANDVAMCLARDNAGSVAGFSDKMNLRCEQLGAINSHFTNPHGLHDPHHFTTAIDLARISVAAMKNPIFRDIVATPEAWLLKGEQFVQLRNHNRLLWRFPGCIGLKTGFTNAAQQVLVSSAMRQGSEVISVVMHSDRAGIWNDSSSLLLYGFERLGIPPPIAESPK